MSNEFKMLVDDGNTAFSDGDFNTAIQCYTRAAAVNPKDAALFVNRCNVYLHLHKWDKAVEDAGSAIALDQTYTKAWFRLGCALVGQENFQYAAVAFNKALTIEPGNKEAYEALQKMRIAQLFFPMCQNLKVTIMYINPDKRRGVFVKKNVLKNETMWKESPVVSLQSIRTKSKFVMCGYCLRSLITDDELVANFLHKDLVDTVHKFSNHIAYEWPQNKPVERVGCSSCSEEVYCSEECRSNAWKEYHSGLCVGRDPKHDHPVLKYRDYITKLPDVNMLSVYLEVVLKICAMIDCEIKDKKGFKAAAWDRFSYFQDRRDPLLPTQQLNEITELLKACFPDLELTSGLIWSKIGQLALNMQFIEPTAVNRTVNVPLPAGAFNDYKEQVDKFAQVPYKANKAGVADMDQGVIMTALAVTEKPVCVALYKLQSCVNHECAPSAVLENYETNEISVIATCDMELGAEICTSYIPMDLSLEERQDKLEWYGFKCACKRCSDELEEKEWQEKMARESKLNKQ
eukprot:TRINITY_DN67868_c4_g1_i8.p1 TRINITY_DN67868_c4_g1~~TRINITY_DN67868_c4_g1_i8.p1  ORF type:complete len:516 (-),score=59.21 TRINITY_DN67868_c4_g1_i8:1589-3136(-)